MQEGEAVTARAAPADDPAAYLPGDRRRAIALGTTIPDRVVGAALFADVSGFTPLTESLAKELGPRRGAEELTAHLNRVFHTVIGEIARFGGEVIYFSGDAITCWFDGDDGTRATAGAVALQREFTGVNRIVTPAGHEVVLAIKVAVAVGPARRFVVGHPDIQLIDVLAGRIVDDLAEAEQQAEKGDIVLAPSAIRSLGGRVRIGDRRPLEGGESVGVLAGLDVDVAPVTPAVDVDLPDELARQWLLPVVWERLRAGRGEFLTELRSAFSMFIRFGGIDYDAESDAVTHLDEFIRGTQEALAEYGGNLLGLTIGDKGAYLYAAFGVPNAHEDDAVRACRAALDIIDLEHHTRARGLQIGITQGRLRAGSYGHAHRHTYTCLGDSVNLAARLMSKAPAGAIYVSADVQLAAGHRFAWRPVGEFVVKGKTEPVTVVALTGLLEGSAQRALRYPLAMVGRDAEVARILAAREAARRGSSRIVAVAAEAGRGKSRLIAEILRTCNAEGDRVLFGEAQAVARKASYLVWRDALRGLFGLDPEQPEEDQRRLVEERLAELGPAVTRRAPLLGPALGLGWADNDLTRTFDAKLRKESLETLLGDVVRDEARRGVVVVVLEDCQWIDPLSRDLLESVARVTTRDRVLFLVAYRPAEAPGGGLGLDQLTHWDEIVLGDLAPAATEQAARARFRQVYGTEVDLAPEVVQVVVERSGGNPFYVEELIGLLHDQGLDPSDPGSAARIDVPDSLERLVLSRIDTLPEDPRRTVKVASVVGRRFEAGLVQRAYPELGGRHQVTANLEVLSDASLVTVDGDSTEDWMFRQVVAREVAYESLPFAMREELHGRVGYELERVGGPHADVDVLAHHFWHSADAGKKRHYLERAAAAAQARYANAAAIEYHERLADLVEPDRRGEVLLALGRLLELVGSWERARTVVAGAMDLARELGDRSGEAWCEVALAEVARKQAQFAEAGERLDRAAAIFEAAGEPAGVGRVLHLQGTLASQQGSYALARERYRASLAIRERLGDRPAMGSLLSNLALVAESEGDLDEAERLNEEALVVREEVGDRWAISVSENNLGMIAYLQGDYAAARRRFERSMELAGEVGDRWIVAVGHHNLGNAFRGLHDLTLSRRHYGAALDVYENFDDTWSLVQLVEDVVLLMAGEGRTDMAFDLLRTADTLREELAAPRPPATAEQLDRALAALSPPHGVAAGPPGDTHSPPGVRTAGEHVRQALSVPTESE